MKQHYKITPEGRGPEPTDQEIARYADGKRLIYNYHRAIRRPNVPIYRDPKAFIALLIIVLLTWLITEVADERHAPPVTEDKEQVD
jgi:hypothetical protein